MDEQDSTRSGRRPMEIPPEVYRDKRITDVECRILGVILSFVPWRKPGKVSTTGIKTIIERSGKSQTAVYRAVSGLIAKGVLERTGGDGANPGFRLIGIPNCGNSIPTIGNSNSQKWESQHYSNHELNHELERSGSRVQEPALPLSEKSSLSGFALDPSPPKPKKRKKPAGPDHATIKALWARHQEFRNEAQEHLGKAKRSQGLTRDVETHLKVLIAGGFTEDQVLDAWRQARNDAIQHPHERNRKHANPLYWFNGATELVAKNVQRLSGQYDGRTAAEAAQRPTTMIGQVTPHWSGSVAMAVTHRPSRPNTPEEEAGLAQAQRDADEADRNGTSIF